MSIEKFSICRDPEWYLAWPDVALADDGRLVCIFSECVHHGDRSYTRIMLCDSFDRGRSWTPKRPLTEGTRLLPYYYNCARITRLRDGRLAVAVDRIPREGESRTRDAVNVLYFSSDHGASWSGAVTVPLRGIVPDKLLELDNGRWIFAAHREEAGMLAEFLIWSDDDGRTWSDEITLAKSDKFHLCEVSILPLGGGVLAGFLRENSSLGYDCKKVLSHDNGESWGEITDFPLPGCHRPVAGFLQDGRILITYRFMQGGRGWLGSWCQNFFAALTDRESVLTEKRELASTRILPVDFDRSPKSDLGYSGWVQFPDGELYIVNYIVDDAVDRGQIRGYSMHPEEFLLEQENQR